MPLPQRSRHWARVLRLTCLAAMAVLTLTALYVSFQLDGFIAENARRFGMADTYRASGITRALLVPGIWGMLAVALYTLWQMATLFACFAQGDALTPGTAQAIHRVGGGLLALAALGVLGHTATGLVLSIDAAPGQRVFSIGLDHADIGFALAGGLMSLIGGVMQQALEIRSENESFV